MNLDEIRFKNHKLNNSFKDAISLKEAAAICLLSEERLLDLARSGFAPHMVVDGVNYFFERQKIYRWVKKNLMQYKTGKPLINEIRILQHQEPNPYGIPEALIPIVDKLREVHGDNFGPCVYFLVSNGSVVYVGQSTNLFMRINSHKANKAFDRVLYLPCTKESLNTVEAAFIRNLKPVLNLTQVGTEMTDRDKEKLIQIGFNESAG